MPILDQTNLSLKNLRGPKASKEQRYFRKDAQLGGGPGNQQKIKAEIDGKCFLRRPGFPVSVGEFPEINLCICSQGRLVFKGLAQGGALRCHSLLSVLTLREPVSLHGARYPRCLERAKCSARVADGNRKNTFAFVCWTRVAALGMRKNCRGRALGRTAQDHLYIPHTLLTCPGAKRVEEHSVYATDCADC